jgi:hypothetical protein
MVIQIANSKTFFPTVTIVGKDNWALHEQRLARARELNREGKRKRLAGGGHYIVARDITNTAVLNVDLDSGIEPNVMEYD